MVKNFTEYKEGFDMELLATALKNGENFNHMEEKVEIRCTGSNSIPIVEKVTSCKITDKFIESNFDKLVALKIIKHK